METEKKEKKEKKETKEKEEKKEKKEGQTEEPEETEGTEETEEEEGCSLALKTYALIAVLDYFNCKTSKEAAQDEGAEEPQKKKLRQEAKKKEEDEESEEEEEEKGKKATTGVFRKMCKTKSMSPPPKEQDTCEWALEYLWQQVPRPMVFLLSPFFLSSLPFNFCLL